MKYNGSGWLKTGLVFGLGIEIVKNPHASRIVDERVAFCTDYHIEIVILWFRFQLNLYKIRKLRKLP